MESGEVTGSYIKKIATKQTVVEARVKCVGTQKVLSACAVATVKVSETLSGEVRLTGKEYVELVLSTESGMSRGTGSVDFSERIEEKSITPTTESYVCCQVLDTEVTSVEGDVVLLASVVELTLYVKTVTTFPQPLQLSDDVFSQDERITLSRLVADVRGSGEITAQDTSGVSRIVATTARTVVSAVEAGVDEVTIVGDVIIEGVGITSDGALTVLTQTVPFSEELEADGSRNGDKARVTAIATEITVEEGENGVNYSVKNEYYGTVYGDVASGVTTDAFSPSCVLDVQRTTVCGTFVKEERRHGDVVEGVISLGDGNADRVLLATGFRFSSLTGVVVNGKVNIEGVMSGSVLYSDAEKNEKRTATVELPFRLTTTAGANESDEIIADGYIGKITVRATRLGELSVRADVTFCYEICEAVCYEVISSVSEGEKYPDKRGIISMFVGKGGEMPLDVAKTLLVRPDVVLAQNPDVTFPLERGNKIFVFRAN